MSRSDFNMIARLLMSRTFVLPVGLISMIVGSLAQDSSIRSSWELDHDAENNQDSSIILWEKNDCPLIDCALFCGMNPSCKSFFQHPSLEKCFGSQSYKRGLPRSQAVQEGWNYYTRPQHCDGGYTYNRKLGVCYQDHRKALDYWKAMAQCETEGAKLLIIRNNDELQYFSNLIPGYWLWIGLRSTMTNTVWRWWNGQLASNVKWYSGSPYYSDNETCGAIQDGMYRNINCSSWRYFLCQRHI